MILGVTLARGGSKGIPKKNIAMCSGKPLIAWTIEAALKSKLLDNYIVCTDDKEITDIVQEYGAEIMTRPPELSGDKVNRWDVLKWVIGQIPEADPIVLLQATSPIRSPGLIDACIDAYAQRPGDEPSDSLATGYWLYDRPYPENRGRNRQEIKKPWSFDDGNVYIWARGLIESTKKQSAGKGMIFYPTSKPENIDINDPFDLWIAEKILNEYPICATK